MARTKDTNKTDATAERAIIVTTEHRGVFFGYVDDDPAATAGPVIKLRRARMCISWSSDMHGVLGLASMGPSRQCRIGPAVPTLELHKITAVMGLAPEAVTRWEAAPWS